MEIRILIVEDDNIPYGTEKAAAESACKKNKVEHELVRYKELRELVDIKHEIGYRFDLMILDLRLDQTVGSSEAETLNELAGIIKSQFIPVVIYSAYTDDIDAESPIGRIPHLIKIVKKGDSSGTPKLEEKISDLLKLKIPLINLKESLERQFVATSSETVNEMLKDGGSSVDGIIQSMIVSRLTSFMVNKMDCLIGSNRIMPAEAEVIYPPLEADANMPVAMGDILEDGEKNLWLVASPSCDMVLYGKPPAPKIKNAILLRCFTEPLDMKTYTGRETVDLMNEKETVIPLRVPKIVSKEGMLMIHTKFYETRLFTEINGWTKVMTVASPYAEDIKATFMRDLMRIGTPNVIPDKKTLLKDFKGN